MRVTRHYSHKQIIHDYTLHQQTLENVQSAKYLGITITENMDWGQLISDISSKATKALGFLRRNLAFAPRSTKKVAYKTLVRPKLEYAAPIWSPYCKTQIQQVEKVQRTAARWTCRRWRNTSTVVLEKCSMSCNGQLWRPGGISPLYFSSTRFIVGLCLLIKTSTWPRLRLQDLPGHHTTHSTAGPRLIVMPWSILFSQGLFLIGIVWLHLWSQLRPQRSSGH